ncbi:DJ-1/PfpI family protein, partial [Lancefieldella parvula]
ICAAPSIYAKRGLLQGKKATSNPGFQHFLSENGAKLIQDAVCVDGSFITSQGAGTALKFGLEIVRYLVGNDAAEKVSQGIVLI